MATLVAFCAHATAASIRDFLPGQPARIWVGGGGGRNPALMAALAQATGVPVATLDEAGVPADAAEAIAFSLMGRNALLGLPNHLPQCTGARHATVLGERAPAGPSAR